MIAKNTIISMSVFDVAAAAPKAMPSAFFFEGQALKMR